MTPMNEKMLAELTRRFGAAGVSIAPGRVSALTEMVTVVIDAGLGTEFALRSFEDIFPEVDALVRAEKCELRRTATNPALVACWNPAELGPYGFRMPPVDDEGCALVRPDVYDELVQVLPWGEAELFDWKSVVESAQDQGLHEAAEWIENHPGDYLLGAYQGFDAWWECD